VHCVLYLQALDLLMALLEAYRLAPVAVCTVTASMQQHKLHTVWSDNNCDSQQQDTSLCNAVDQLM
jgi:hypothetical protein